MLRESDVVYRSCPLCEAHCGIAIEVDRRDRRVVTIRGDREDPFSRGFICPKAYGLKELDEDPDRLRRPVRRTASGFEEIGWDDALDLAAAGLRRIRDAHGTDAIAVYLGNPTAHDMGALVYGQTLLRALGTRWRFSATSVDQLPKMVSSALLFGGTFSIPVPDVDRTSFLLVLGANPVVSNGSLMTAPDMPGRLKALRARGGRLVVVDPRRTETARLADEHVFIRPGTDALLLAALVHVLFAEDLVDPAAAGPWLDGMDGLRDRVASFPPEAVAAATGVPAATTRRIARDFAAASSAACYGRIGTCTQEFGTLASWLVDAVNLLTGNLDRPGGVLFPRPAAFPGGPRPRPRPLPYGRWRSRVRGLPEFAGELPVATLAEEIDDAGDERIRGLVTVAGNPVLSTPNGARLARALASLDFVVATDIYVNETTRFADVILPPVSQLERTNYDFGFQRLSVRHVAKYSPRVFDPPADGRQQWEILLELGARFAGVSAADMEETMFSTLLSGALGRLDGAVDEASARATLGPEPGPDRILDLLLRSGPWGDAFRDDREGLSLAKLASAEHGIDLGPLEPRLGEMLATENRRIDLAPDFLAPDFDRLRARLDRQADGLLLVGRRQLRNNNSWMHNVRALAKGPERCVLLVHPEDARSHGLVDGSRVRLRSRVGEVEVPITLTDEVMPGVVSLPHGFGHDAPGARLGVAASRPGVNSNILADEELLDPVSGNAVLNGIPVTIGPA